MSRKIGNDNENLALSFLKKKGLKLIAKNFYSRFGEIDLIMRDKETLVFVEVRYRGSEKFGSSLESVSWHKQQRLIKTAEYYLLSSPQNLPCRFDVLAVSPHNTQSINWIKNAFGLNL
ncbi:MAG: protein Nwat [Gammaproteobacteria bacterium]|jgi:putative endonuclease|nr:protein Nwat [Gammaproteobacteria bacterium]